MWQRRKMCGEIGKIWVLPQSDEGYLCINSNGPKYNISKLNKTKHRVIKFSRTKERHLKTKRNKVQNTHKIHFVFLKLNYTKMKGKEWHTKRN